MDCPPLYSSVMKFACFLSLFAILINPLFGQRVYVVGSNGQNQLDCLIMDLDGNVAKGGDSTGVYDILGLNYPIRIYTYGYRTENIVDKIEGLDTVKLKVLQDNLNQAEVVSNRISPEESIIRIVNNTTSKYSPPQVLYQKFEYVLLSSSRDTMAFANGTVQRVFKNGWDILKPNSFYKKVNSFFLNPSYYPELSRMWATPFVDIGKFNFNIHIPYIINNKNASAEFTLDSIALKNKIHHYYFNGEIVLDTWFSKADTIKLNFTGSGLSLKSAVLNTSRVNQNINSKGMRYEGEYTNEFCDQYGYYEFESFTRSFNFSDEKCPGCTELLILKTSESKGKKLSKASFRTGYFNLFNFKKVAERDSTWLRLLNGTKVD